ncbi:MarR family winged helix-turn-helix transcriptional regulator [Actinoplanes sp. NPDC051494]|uniref:MarR family winged helix-turn-helix transcriptional regulator n=1 Tax=Actinoplanes sp. NPDC051494 TaxID=3363907 RepID=UPI0037A50003
MEEHSEEGDTLFRPGQRSRVLQLMRAYTDAHLELTRHLARSLGVHVNDAVATSEILWAETVGKPLTPAGLSDRIGHSSGATATLLNRLENAGLVTRSREDADRRIVRLRLTPEARSRTETFFAPTGKQMDQVLDGYDEVALTQLEGLLTTIVAVTADRNEHLRETSSSTLPGEDRN